MFTDEEFEMLQRRIDDPDWDISQRNDVWELLPRLLETAKAAEQSVQADLGWTCGKCGTSANVGYRCSWCEEKRPSR